MLLRYSQHQIFVFIVELLQVSGRLLFLPENFMHQILRFLIPRFTVVFEKEKNFVLMLALFLNKIVVPYHKYLVHAITVRYKPLS